MDVFSMTDKKKSALLSALRCYLNMMGLYLKDRW